LKTFRRQLAEEATHGTSALRVRYPTRHISRRAFDVLSGAATRRWTRRGKQATLVSRITKRAAFVELDRLTAILRCEAISADFLRTIPGSDDR
jgi:hypothetical protein